MLTSSTNYHNFKTLKGRLAFLRKLQLVGEIFIPRNLGNHLKYINYIDSDMLCDIRNGLTHIEDYPQSIDVIEKLESDPERLKKIFRELQTLKEQIYEEIVKRQREFLEWPPEQELVLNQTGSSWQKFAKEYWEKVKAFYAVDPKLEFQNYVPKIILLPKGEVGKIKKGVDSQYHKKIEEIFFGDSPFVDRSTFEGLIKLGINQKIRNSIFKFYNQARNEYRGEYIEAMMLSKYTNIYHLGRFFEKGKEWDLRLMAELPEGGVPEQRKVYLEKQKEKLEYVALHPTKGVVREPLDLLVSGDLKEYLNKRRNRLKILEKISKKGYMQGGKPIPSIKERIFALLKNRITTLVSLIKETGISIDDKVSLQKTLSKRLLSDMAFSLSTSYVLGQVIGVFNKLYELTNLEVISTGIKRKLLEYVSLRNFLEHTDPILESVDLPYYHMVSDLQRRMSVVIGELIFDYSKLLNYAPEKLPDRLQGDIERLKQDEAVDSAIYQFSSENSLELAEKQGKLEDADGKDSSAYLGRSGSVAKVLTKQDEYIRISSIIDDSNEELRSLKKQNKDIFCENMAKQLLKLRNGSDDISEVDVRKLVEDQIKFMPNLLQEIFNRHKVDLIQKIFISIEHDRKAEAEFLHRGATSSSRLSFQVCK